MSRAAAEIEDSGHRWWRPTVVAVVIAIATSLAATVYIYRRESGRVERLLAEIRARGEPATGKELDAYYAQPKPDDDATDLWVMALAEVETTIGLARSDPFSGVPIQGNAESAPIPVPSVAWDDLLLSKQYLREIADSLSTLHAAADFGGHTRYPGSVAGISTALLTRVQTARDAARRLELEACVRAHEGDAAGLTASLHAALMLAQSMRDEPVTATMLVRIAIHGIPVSQLLRFLPYVDFSDEHLATLQRDLESAEFKSQLIRATGGDRTFGVDSFAQIAAGASIANPHSVAYFLTRPRDEVTYIRMMNDWVALAKEPWPKMLAGSDAMGAKWDAHRTLFDLLSNDAAAGCGIGFEAAAWGEVMNRFAMVVIAVERMRRASGRAPESLHAVAGENTAAVPDDPLTGESFCYENDTDRYVLYSRTRRDPVKTAVKAAKAIQVDPGQLIERAQKEAQVPPGSIWELPASTNPYLLFRWPPLPEQTQANDASQVGAH